MYDKSEQDLAERDITGQGRLVRMGQDLGYMLKDKTEQDRTAQDKMGS